MALSSRVNLLLLSACLFAIAGIISTNSLLPTARFRPRSGSASPAGYFVSLPNTLRIGETNAIHYSVSHLHHACRFSLSLSKHNTLSFQSPLITQETTTGRLDISIPSTTPEGVYELRMTFENEAGEEQFHRQAPITLRKTPVTLLVETDRPYYKPGQEVLIHVFSLTDELLVRKGPVSILVSDPKNFKLAKWDLETDEFGFAEARLPLSVEPNLGTWEIQVISGESSAFKSFKVEKYVLPKFGISVDMMKGYITPTEKDLSGIITATYSYGKPLRGRALISAFQSGLFQAWKRPSMVKEGPPFHHAEGRRLLATSEEDINGSTVFELQLKDVPLDLGQEIELEIKVLEAETNDAQVIKKRLLFVREPVTYSFSDEIFKPGLPFSTTLKAFLADGRPYDRVLSLKAEMSSPNSVPTVQTLTVETKNGEASLLFDIPEGATSLCIAINGLHCQHQFRRAFSSSNAHLSVIQEEAAAGLVSFRVFSTKVIAISPSFPLLYQVVARGRIITSGLLTRGNLIQLKPLSIMAPKARLLVYTFFEGELVVGHADFSVSSLLPNAIEVSLGEQVTSPASNISISVKTSPFSRYGLLAIDKSAAIMGGNSQLQASEVLGSMEAYSLIQPFETHPLRRQIGAKTLLSKSGTLVFTNFEITDDPSPPEPPVLAMGWALGEVLQERVMLIANEAEKMDAPAPGRAAEDAPVRSFFPETWLALSKITDAHGEASLQATAPDSMTSWSFFSFSLSKERGLGIGKPQELQVLKPFFLSLDLPYSAIFGELLPIKVVLYNYHSESLRVTVTLDRSSDFEVVEAPPQPELQLGSQEVKVALFYIRPRQMEPLKITVRAKSLLLSDAVQKILLIESPGVRETMMKSIIVSHPEASTTETKISLKTPATFVKGSERATLSIAGDLMGPTMKGLEALLQMPCGCGEQNMLNFAPDVFVARYLKATNQMKSDILEKALKLMVTGYQRELTFVHADGSFSAFGESDEEGSMWLTAFVVKTFAQARGLIYIDEQVITKAIHVILSKQLPSGQFPQTGRVIHTSDLMGGEKGDLAHSAFVLISLVEAGADPTAIERGRKYLEDNLEKVTEIPYNLAIVSYALSLAQSRMASKVLKVLQKKAIISADKLVAHWGAPKDDSSSETCTYCPGAITTLDIEATSYALLALLSLEDLELSQKAARWLMQQRSSAGGFLSTQDTCLGLQALSSFVEKTYSQEVDLQVVLTHSSDPDFRKSFSVHQKNLDVVQATQFPVNGTLIASITGKGTAIIQAEVRYNVPGETSLGTSDPFQIQVTMRNTQEKRIQTEACVTSLLEADPGMTLLEVGLFTGFEARPEDVNVLLSQPEVKRIEHHDKKVVLYLDGLLSHVKYCFSFLAHPRLPVRDLKPAVSTVFAYYSPHLRGTTTSVLT